MKFLKLLVLLTVILASCSQEKESKNTLAKDTIDIIHFNITITPDLSNRLNSQLNPRPLTDVDIAKVIVRNLYPNIAKHRRSTNQLDKLETGFINKTSLTSYNVNSSNMILDLSHFDSQIDRIRYLTDQSARTFSNDTALFIDEFRKTINKAQAKTYGADIWSYFQSGINDQVVNKQSSISWFNEKPYRNKFRNILILITDGYIEAGIYKNGGCPDSPSECFYLSKSRVSDIREQFKKSGSSNLSEYIKHNDVSIIPAGNKNLENLEIMVLELYDRSLTKGGTPTVYPTDLDIMSELWSKWLKDSNVKRFEIKPIFSSKEEAERSIMTFILNE